MKLRPCRRGLPGRRWLWGIHWQHSRRPPATSDDFAARGLARASPWKTHCPHRNMICVVSTYWWRNPALRVCWRWQLWNNGEMKIVSYRKIFQEHIFLAAPNYSGSLLITTTKHKIILTIMILWMEWINKSRHLTIADENVLKDLL